MFRADPKNSLGSKFPVDITDSSTIPIDTLDYLSTELNRPNPNQGGSPRVDASAFPSHPSPIAAVSIIEVSTLGQKGIPLSPHLASHLASIATQ